MPIHKFGFYRGFVFSLLLILGCCGSLFAQGNTTSMSGTVVDPQGGLIPGVSIALTSTTTGAKQTTVTKAQGEYAFSQLTPDTYEVRVNGDNFSEQIQTVTLLIGTPVKLNFTLRIGTSQVVNVETSLAVINSTDGTLGKAFDSKQVQNLPYLANNVTYLLSLQPGVLGLDSGAQTGGLNTDTRTGIVNGARQDQTNITLDGVDNNDVTNGYAFNGALRSTRDSVQEFRVTTTNAGAEAGRSSGGQVSLMTRGGTNTYHGSAYEYYRGGVGLQNEWYNKQSQLARGVANVPVKVLQHTYGASFGAPVMKDKLFFFGAYEGFKQASGQTASRTVPSIIGGGGLYTGNVTYAACAVGTTCASSTNYKTLTQSDIKQMDKQGIGTNQAALAYFKQFPLSNTPGTSSSADNYNTGLYSFVTPLPIHQITNIAKLDYKISDKQSLFVRGNLQSDNQATALQFPGLPPASNIFSNNKGIAAGHIWNLRSNLTNNLRYGLVRQGSATRGTGSQPYTSFSLISTITATTTSNVYFITTHNWADDLTWTKGHHTFQVGANERLVYNSRYFDSPLLSNATISATILANAGIAGTGTSFDAGAFTCPNCAPVATGFKTFYNAAIINNAGVIENASSGTEYLVQNGALTPAGTGVVPTHVYKNWEHDYYFQDQWNATPRLTFTAGVRYSYLGVPFETKGQQIAPTINLNDFLKNRVAAAAAGGSYNTSVSFRTSGSANNQPDFWTPQKANFGPRVSFAWSTPDNKTAVHGGFALVFDHMGTAIINQYESSSSSLLSLSKTNSFAYSNIETNPRFTGYNNVPLGTVTNGPIALPATPASVPFSFLRSINQQQKTPYAETFNLTVQQEMARGMIFTMSYVGRLGHHVLANLDVAQPLNLVDTVSGQNYYQAIQAFDKMVDSGTTADNVADSGYFHNMFPNASYKPSGSTVTYKGAQAYYAYLKAAARGNETDPLFNWDTSTAASAAGQSFRFFYPQTSSIYTQSTVANSNYHALQVSVRHVLKSGFQYDVNYTWSKAMDQGSSPERSNGNNLHNTVDQHGEYSVADFDVRHNVTANYNLALPFGKGRAFLNTSGWLDRIVGGWQLNGVAHFNTAFPFSAVATGNYGTNFASASYKVKTSQAPSGGHHYNATTKSVSALNGVTIAQAVAATRFAYGGEVGRRNDFRADGYFSLDNGMSKSFRTWREQAFKISVEIFNVTGSPRFNTPSTNGTSSTAFGNYSATLNQPRQMQFSGKYTF